MSRFSGNPTGAGAQRKAWSYLITNLLVLPGLGSIMAGRVSGWFEAILAIVGAVVGFVFLGKIGLYYIQVQSLPSDMGLYLGVVGGLAVFLLGWLWSLVTSVALLRAEAKSPPVLETP